MPQPITAKEWLQTIATIIVLVAFLAGMVWLLGALQAIMGPENSGLFGARNRTLD